MRGDHFSSSALQLVVEHWRGDASTTIYIRLFHVLIVDNVYSVY